MIDGSVRVKAQNILEHPESHPSLERLNPREINLLLWQHLTWGPWYSWAVIDARSSLRLRRVIWDRRRDIIQPTTYGYDELLSPDIYKDLIAKLEGLRIKPFIDGTMGLDGTTYGLRWRKYSNESRIEWWYAGKGLKHLHVWYMETITLFDSLLPEPPIPLRWRPT